MPGDAVGAIRLGADIREAAVLHLTAPRECTASPAHFENRSKVSKPRTAVPQENAMRTRPVSGLWAFAAPAVAPPAAGASTPTDSGSYISFATSPGAFPLVA